MSSASRPNMRPVICFILRSLCRSVSDAQRRKCAAADERSEEGIASARSTLATVHSICLLGDKAFTIAARPHGRLALAPPQSRALRRKSKKHQRCFVRCPQQRFGQPRRLRTHTSPRGVRSGAHTVRLHFGYFSGLYPPDELTPKPLPTLRIASSIVTVRGNIECDSRLANSIKMELTRIEGDRL